MNRATRPPKKSDYSAWRYGLLLALLVVLAMLMMEFNSRMSELRRLSAQREEVRAQATVLMQTKSALELQIAHATSEAAVLEWAYGEAHMRRPGDNPVVPVPAGQVVPTPTPTNPPLPPTESNLQRWYDLFNGTGDE